MQFDFEKSKSGFLNPVNNTVDKLMSASKGLMCLKSTIFGGIPNPSSILQGLAGMAAGMVSAIVGSVKDVINKKVGQIINSVMSPIRQLEQMISEITDILVSVQGITIQGILDKALNMNLYFKDKQDCANSASNLMNCLAQSAINKVSSAVAMNVDKHIGGIADSISKDAFKVSGSISGYLNRQKGFIEKAQMQTKLLT